jgi:hypothetical protein
MHDVSGTAVDTERAQIIWNEYQAVNDLSDKDGQIAAIDPISGKVWIGETPSTVASMMRAIGSAAPVYLVRVGEDHFVRKGRR